NLSIINIFINLNESRRIYKEALAFLLNQAKIYNRHYHAEHVQTLARLGNHEFTRAKMVLKLLCMLQTMNERSSAFALDALLKLSETKQGFSEILNKVLPDLKNNFN